MNEYIESSLGTKILSIWLVVFSSSRSHLRHGIYHERGSTMGMLVCTIYRVPTYYYILADDYQG